MSCTNCKCDDKKTKVKRKKKFRFRATTRGIQKIVVAPDYIQVMRGRSRYCCYPGPVLKSDMVTYNYFKKLNNLEGEERRKNIGNTEIVIKELSIKQEEMLRT